MSLTPGRAFYNRQIACLESRDIAGLMTQYHDDAVLVGFEFTIKGADAIRRHMEGYLKELGKLRLVSTDKFTETEDSIFFEATMSTNLGVARVYDVFILRGEKAIQHFTGVISAGESRDV